MVHGGTSFGGTVDVEGYLRRLRLAHTGAPSVDALFALHRAHVSRVPYETLQIQLDRPTTVDPYESAARVVSGRGGYCYHLNGAFSALLDALGYPVTWHRGGVFGEAAQATGASGNHLALTVDVGGQTWFVDVGLGDALYEPLPLRPGTYRQAPFTYQLLRSPVESGGWRFVHDGAGSFAGMDFASSAATPGDFAAKHLELSTSPDSAFVQVAQVGRRTASGFDLIRGCHLRHVGPGGRTDREITRRDDWFDVVRYLFGMALSDVDEADRARLWARLWRGHQRFVASHAAERLG